MCLAADTKHLSRVFVIAIAYRALVLRSCEVVVVAARDTVNSGPGLVFERIHQELHFLCGLTLEVLDQ